jgi:general secretion pathway protein A
MATPEAADEKPADAPSVPVESGFNTDSLKRLFRNPRVIAFVIVLIIWFGLVAMFLVNQQRTVLVEGAGRNPGVTKTQDNEAVSQNHANTGGENRRDGGGAETKNDLTAETPTSDQAAASTEKPASLKKTVPPAVAVSPPPARNQADPVVSPENGQPFVAVSDDAGNAARISLAEIKEKFGAYPEVRFGFNSNKLDPESYDILGLIARYCLQNPGAAIVLRGYTDRSGVRAYNLKLSEFRADMVKTYLVGRGVKESRIDSIAMGPGTAGPAGEDPSEEGSNRKVVIEIIPPPE